MISQGVRAASVFASAAALCGLLLQHRPLTGAVIHSLVTFLLAFPIWCLIVIRGRKPWGSRGALAGMIIMPIGWLLSNFVVFSIFPGGIPGAFTILPPIDSFQRLAVAAVVHFIFGFFWVWWVELPLSGLVGYHIASTQERDG